VNGDGRRLACLVIAFLFCFLFCVSLFSMMIPTSFLRPNDILRYVYVCGSRVVGDSLVPCSLPWSDFCVPTFSAIRRGQAQCPTHGKPLTLFWFSTDKTLGFGFFCLISPRMHSGIIDDAGAGALGCDLVLCDFKADNPSNQFKA